MQVRSMHRVRAAIAFAYAVVPLLACGSDTSSYDESFAASDLPGSNTWSTTSLPIQGHPAMDEPGANQVETVLLVDESPAVLFKDGWASLEIEVLSSANPEADRQRNAARWVRWRARSAGGYELEMVGGWDFPGHTECKAFQPGARFNAVFARKHSATTISGAGQATSLVAQSTFVFNSDGTFVTGSFAYGTSISAAVSSAAPSKHGSYEIDGYRLVLRKADGTTEIHTLIDAYSAVVIYIDELRWER
jgi:hypothetical protein